MGDSAQRATVASPRGVPTRCCGLQFLEVWCELALFCLLRSCRYLFGAQIYVDYAKPRRRSILLQISRSCTYANADCRLHRLNLYGGVYVGDIAVGVGGPFDIAIVTTSTTTCTLPLTRNVLLLPPSALHPAPSHASRSIFFKWRRRCWCRWGAVVYTGYTRARCWRWLGFPRG